MSKVHGIDGIPKEKLIHRNRRIETKKKKNQRMRDCRNGTYNYGSYWVQDETYVREYKQVTIPERKIEKGHYEWKSVPVRDYEGNIERYVSIPSFVIDKIIVIPEHEGKQFKNSYWVPLKSPMLRRSDLRRKKYRKVAARRFRRIDPLADIGNGATYKRYYDIAWEIY